MGDTSEIRMDLAAHQNAMAGTEPLGQPHSALALMGRQTSIFAAHEMAMAGIGVLDQPNSAWALRQASILAAHKKVMAAIVRLDQPNSARALMGRQARTIAPPPICASVEYSEDEIADAHKDLQAAPAIAENKPVSTKLFTAPGWKLHRLASFICSRKTFDRVFAQTLRDMQDEHIEALNEGRLWKARWVVLRGHWSFWSAVAAQLPLSAAKKLYEIRKIGH